METTTFYRIGESTLEYDPAVPCIILNHVGFVTSEEFRIMLNTALDFFIEKKKVNRIMGWLPNLVQTDIFPDDDMKWVASDLNPRAYEAGLRQMAIVLPEDSYAFVNVSAEAYQEYTQEDMGETIINRFFKDMESAKAWLRGQLTDVN